MNDNINNMTTTPNYNTAEENTNNENYQNFDEYIKNTSPNSKPIICENFKISYDGGFLGYIDGRWEKLDTNFENTVCDPNEILIHNGGLTEVGVNIVKNMLGSTQKVKNTSYALQKDAVFSDMPNSLTFVPEKRITLSDGTILEWETSTVNYKPCSNNESDISQAQKLADLLDDFTRLANREVIGIGKCVGISKDKSNDLAVILAGLDIDLSEKFYINGKEFIYDNETGEIKFELESSVNGDFTVRHSHNSLKFNNQLVKMQI